MTPYIWKYIERVVDLLMTGDGVIVGAPASAPASAPAWMVSFVT